MGTLVFRGDYPLKSGDNTIYSQRHSRCMVVDFPHHIFAPEPRTVKHKYKYNQIVTLITVITHLFELIDITPNTGIT